jgi:oligopeptide/dipeptide ABC transporter ATP-binding protein
VLGVWRGDSYLKQGENLEQQLEQVPSLLRVENLNVQYYLPEGVVRAVDGVDLRIGPKEIVGLVGESGSGKSTLGLAIMRMVSKPGKIVEGTIAYKGDDLLKLSEEALEGVRGKEISIIFQDPFSYLNPLMKIEKQITEKIILHQKVSKSQAREDALRLLKEVQIPSPEDVLNYYPFQLSGGMLQRVLIVIAVACQPSLIIADECTTALDNTVQAQVLRLLKDIANKFQTSFLVITHDIGIVAEICDRVYVMYAGKVVERADTISLFSTPIHPYTSGLLTSALSIDAYKEDFVGIKGSPPSVINPPAGCRFHPRCTLAKEICREKEPPLFELENGHAHSCWVKNESA